MSVVSISLNITSVVSAFAGWEASARRVAPTVLHCGPARNTHRGSHEILNLTLGILNLGLGIPSQSPSLPLWPFLPSLTRRSQPIFCMDLYITRPDGGLDRTPRCCRVKLNSRTPVQQLQIMKLSLEWNLLGYFSLYQDEMWWWLWDRCNPQIIISDWGNISQIISPSPIKHLAKSCARFANKPRWRQTQRFTPTFSSTV